MIWSRSDLLDSIFFRNVRNLRLVKTLPLSDTTTSGNPWVAKVDLSMEMTLEDFVCTNLVVVC